MYSCFTYSKLYEKHWNQDNLQKKIKQTRNKVSRPATIEVLVTPDHEVARCFYRNFNSFSIYNFGLGSNQECWNNITTFYSFIIPIQEESLARRWFFFPRPATGSGLNLCIVSNFYPSLSSILPYLDNSVTDVAFFIILASW